MNREHRFCMTLSDQEHEALKRLADEEGFPLAAIMRQLIRKSAKEKGLWPAPKKDT